MSRLFLDGADQRPPDQGEVDLLGAALARGWADPAGGHFEARRSDALLREASDQVGRLLGGTRAEWAADLRSAVASTCGAACERFDAAAVATSSIDRLVVADAIVETGRPSRILPVTDGGHLDLDCLSDLPDRTVLVLQVGNHEIGTRQPLEQVVAWCRDTGSALVLDATCAVGWAPIPAGWAALIADPRAWGAPAGATVSVWAVDAEPAPPFANVPAAVVSAVALQNWLAAAPKASADTRRVTRHLRRRVLDAIPDAEVHGGRPTDLPHILSVSLLYVDGEALQAALDARGFAVGSGSACASRTGHPSHVLAAIGGLTSGNVRIGLSPGVTGEQVDAFCDALAEEVARLRDEIGARDL